MKKIIKIKPVVFPKRALSYNRSYIVLFRTDVRAEQQKLPIPWDDSPSNYFLFG